MTKTLQLNLTPEELRDRLREVIWSDTSAKGTFKETLRNDYPWKGFVRDYSFEIGSKVGIQTGFFKVSGKVSALDKGCEVRLTTKLDNPAFVFVPLLFIIVIGVLFFTGPAAGKSVTSHYIGVVVITAFLVGFFTYAVKTKDKDFPEAIILLKKLEQA